MIYNKQSLSLNWILITYVTLRYVLKIFMYKTNMCVQNKYVCTKQIFVYKTNIYVQKDNHYDIYI